MCWGAWRVARQGPHTMGAFGRGGNKENHPGLNRNFISQVRHRAAPGGECTLEEPLCIPMGGFALVTDNIGSLTVTCLSTTPNYKNNNQGGSSLFNSEVLCCSRVGIPQVLFRAQAPGRRNSVSCFTVGCYFWIFLDP